MSELPVIPDKELPDNIIKEIAMDIGKATVAYIEVMYPEAIKATSSTFKLSVRNHIYNDIMAAIKVNDEGQIIRRLDERKKFRRQWLKNYRDLRKPTPTTTIKDEAKNDIT